MARAGSLWGVVGPTHGGARMRAMDTDPYRTLVAAHDADRPCLVLADGTTWTYGDLRDRAAGLGGALRAAGVGTGDRVVVQVGKSADAVALYVACLARKSVVEGKSGSVRVDLGGR